MDLFGSKLKAATLAEALVAMVVVMLSFGIAIVVFSNVTRSSSIPEKTRAEIVLKELLIISKNEKNFLDGTMERGGLKVEKKVVPYGTAKGLSLLTFIAFDRHNKKITECNELIFPE